MTINLLKEITKIRKALKLREVDAEIIKNIEEDIRKVYIQISNEKTELINAYESTIKDMDKTHKRNLSSCEEVRKLILNELNRVKNDLMLS